MKHFSPSEPLNGYTDPFSADPTAPRPYSHQKNALLRQQHGGGSGMLPECVIWNYIIQLTSALRVIHAAGLACRTLDPTKILLTGRSRLRLSSLAISDVLTFDTSSPNPLQLIPHFQVLIQFEINRYFQLLSLYNRDSIFKISNILFKEL